MPKMSNLLRLGESRQKEAQLGHKSRLGSQTSPASVEQYTGLELDQMQVEDRHRVSQSPQSPE